MERFESNPFLKFLGWWFFWTALGSWLLHSYGLTWTLAIGDSALSQMGWAMAAYVVSVVVQYYQPSLKNRVNILALSFTLAAVFSYGLLPWILPSVLPEAAGYRDFLSSTKPARLAIMWIQLLYIAAIGWLWRFLKEQQEHKEREADAAKLIREAELSQLRQQLQPHFLFNSLNSSNALVVSQPQQARTMVQQLSDFLRGTVRKDDRQRVTLEEELAHLQLYMDIEKVRFGYRLNSVLEAEDTAKQMVLPPMMLQPLVENAIKFGLYDTLGEITISIKGEAKEGSLLVRIENPFDPSTSAPKAGTGFGLSSIARRLYLIYSQNDLLTTHTEGNRFVTTIKIPQPR